jgi:hypothetical protein
VYVPSLPGAPREVYAADPSRVSLRFEELWLQAADGVRLHAWLCSAGGPLAGGARAPGRGPTLLFFQENAGNMSHRLQNVKYMVDRLACNVLIISYRGRVAARGSARRAAMQP